MRKYRWVWRRVRVALFIALTLSIGLRLAHSQLGAHWTGWAAVRYGVGAAFVIGLFAYALVTWLRSR